MSGPVRQLRLVVRAQDWQQAVAFYRDVLGMAQEADYSSGDAHVVVLDAGRATIELVDQAQHELIDDVEVGRRVAPAIRVAVEVDDARATAQALSEAGAEVVAPPTLTPWNSLNARLDAPAGLHLTVFTELGPEADTTGGAAQPG